MTKTRKTSPAKKAPKKLKVKRETIRDLGVRKSTDIKGGASAYLGCHLYCTRAFSGCAA